MSASNPFWVDPSAAVTGATSFARSMQQMYDRDQQEGQFRATQEVARLDKVNALRQAAPTLVPQLGIDAVTDMFVALGEPAPSRDELLVAGRRRMSGYDAATGAGSARMETAGVYPDSGRNTPGARQSGAAQPRSRGGASADPTAMPPYALDIELGAIAAARQAALAAIPRRYGGARGKVRAQAADAYSEAAERPARPTSMGPSDVEMVGVGPGAAAPLRRGQTGTLDQLMARSTGDPRLMAVYDEMAALDAADAARPARSRREIDESTARIFGDQIEPKAGEVLDYRSRMAQAQRPRSNPFDLLRYAVERERRHEDQYSQRLGRIDAEEQRDIDRTQAQIERARGEARSETAEERDRKGRGTGKMYISKGGDPTANARADKLEADLAERRKEYARRRAAAEDVRAKEMLEEDTARASGKRLRDTTKKGDKAGPPKAKPGMKIQKRVVNGKTVYRQVPE